MVSDKDKKNVIDRIQRDELAQLTKELVDIPSPTGSEKAIGEFILGWYSRHGIKPVRQEIDPNRVNAVGIVKGRGDGVSLMINGHMDTSYTGTDEDRMFCRELEPDSELKGAVRDGKVFGLGASNMKSGLAAFMVAGKAIRESGLILKGDLILAAVAGEISRTPVGPYQSGAYRGEGTGTHHLLSHGIQSDCAIVADRSGHSIVWAQTGVAQIKVTTFGDPHAAWGVTREEKPPEVSSAILKMMRVVQAVDAWAAEFERAHVYSSAHGPIVPKVNIGAIQGALRFDPITIQGFALFILTCGLRRDCARCRCSASCKRPCQDSASNMNLKCMPPRWGTRPKASSPSYKLSRRVISRCSARKLPLLPAFMLVSGQTPTSTMNWGYEHANSVSAADAGSFAPSKSMSKTLFAAPRSMRWRRWKFAIGKNYRRNFAGLPADSFSLRFGAVTAKFIPNGLSGTCPIWRASIS